MTYAPITKKAEKGSMWDRQADSDIEEAENDLNQDAKSCSTKSKSEIDLNELNDFFAVGNKVSVQDRIGKFEDENNGNLQPIAGVMKPNSEQTKILSQTRSLNLNILQ